MADSHAKPISSSSISLKRLPVKSGNGDSAEGSKCCIACGNSLRIGYLEGKAKRVEG